MGRKSRAEERVNLAISMSSVVARICVDSILDQDPKLEEVKVILQARRRIAFGRNLHQEV